MDIIPGITQDCHAVGKTVAKRRLLPEHFYSLVDSFEKYLTKEGVEWKKPQGDASDKVDHVLWNIMSRVPGVQIVCETGMERTLLWLASSGNARVFTIEPDSSNFSKSLVSFTEARFPGRHKIARGDSAAFVEENPNIICDVIYVNGGRLHEIYEQDMSNLFQLAHIGSVVVLDFEEHSAVWEKGRRNGRSLEVFKCLFERSNGFSVGLVTKTKIV
jgi:hypothetical protein